FHQPVMVGEAAALLVKDRGARLASPLRLVDATLGDGGHAAALLEAAPNAELIGIDRDPQALARARERLARLTRRIALVHAHFAHLGNVLDEHGWQRCDGVIADLGVSSLQLDEPSRGFSFRHPATLDMRMDPDEGESAAELVERLTAEELAQLLRD